MMSGTTTKIISNASSTSAHKAVAARPRARIESGPPPIAANAAVSQRSVPKGALHEREDGRRQQQREERAGDHQRVLEHGAQHLAAQRAGGDAVREEGHPARRGRLDGIQIPERHAGEQRHDERRGERGGDRVGARAGLRCGVARFPPAPRGDRDAACDEEARGDQRGMEHVLRIHDEPGDRREVRRLGVRTHHGVAQQDQHQRRGHDHAQRARHAHQRHVALLGHADLRETRVERLREHRDAGTRRAAHRGEQHAEQESRERHAAAGGASAARAARNSAARERGAVRSARP